MLKALELHGFKSFADKTRFEFPAGITVIVGPNGSGKSNIVDGIKWVLGEQSAKSLRGKDMADVIFKGSGSGRKAAQAAEATLVFDNSEGRLPIDAPEVHITRRVFRSGEGEYLINRQPARLKDIRDMVRGTGVGVDAYSMIEQGKVDRLLQASAKDRRAIFEEAAGISRFKAKKIEAQRRLERVDQNLLRLSDIVEEVDARLKTVRNQAAKARRYREYSTRLQQLRTQTAQVDWRKLAEQLEAITAKVATFTSEKEELVVRVQELEQIVAGSASQSQNAATALRTAEAKQASLREQIAQQESAADFHRQTSKQQAEAAREQQQQLVTMTDRFTEISARLKETHEQLAAATVEQSSVEAQLAAAEATAAALTTEYQTLRSSLQEKRDAHLAASRLAAQLAAHLESRQKQLEVLEQTTRDSLGQQEQLASALATLATDKQQTQQAIIERTAAVQSSEASLAEARANLAQVRDQQTTHSQELAKVRQRSMELSQRVALLEELERNLEGVGAGVKALLAEARFATEGPLTKIRGVVADVIQSAVEHAAAIDLALGDAAQLGVVEGEITDVQEVLEAAATPSSRLTMIATGAHRRDELPSAPATVSRDGAVIGRADKLVQFDPRYAPLVRRLLGTTWVVRTLSDALGLHRSSGSTVRLVTLTGEVIEPNGSIATGPRSASLNLVSRKSQLRELKTELAAAENDLASAELAQQQLADAIIAATDTLSSAEKLARSCREEQRAETSKLERLEQRETSLSEQLTKLDLAIQRAREEQDKTGIEVSAIETRLAISQQESQRLDGVIAAEEQAREALESRREEATRRGASHRVTLARCEQKCESLRARQAQLEDDFRERSQAIEAVRLQLASAVARAQAADLAWLATGQQLAHLYLAKQETAAELRTFEARHQAIERERSTASGELQKLLRRLRTIDEQLTEEQLATGQIQQRQESLASRLREDYGIEIAELCASSTAEELEQRTAIEEEIESLRRKINQIGAVNLDALEELDELESRYTHLSTQYKDLTEAKQALERVIHKMNADSRRLFIETLEAIRVNFQALYRKAFGGGKADIVLEEGVDVLECGVEIIATPPGKPSFNNSLLSGGEKALTAVALLLAIFQFRPSPFCVLDEVDAPFDEANIGRFVDVLKEFLGWTKFVIVTHSKKTMTAATTLYGVTMQESGVSKRVSVRFDDVTEDGHIRERAHEMSEEASDESSRGVA